jgi:hypothetical protein
MANKENEIKTKVSIIIKENRILDDDFEARLRKMADEESD